MSSLHLAEFLVVHSAIFCGLLALCLGVCERNGELGSERHVLLFFFIPSSPCAKIARFLCPKSLAGLPFCLLTLLGLQVPVRGCLVGWGRGTCTFSKVKWRSAAHEGDAAASCIGLAPQVELPLVKNLRGAGGFSLEGEFWSNSALLLAEPETRARALPLAGSICCWDP